MEKKLYVALNCIGGLALVLVVVLFFQVWKIIEPVANVTSSNWDEINLILESRKQRKQLKEDLKDTNQTTWDVLVKYIFDYLPKNYTFNGMDKSEYVNTLVEAIMLSTESDDEALWVASIAQVESSFQIKRCPKTSTAKGLLQVIWRWHKRDLSKIGYTATELQSNIGASVGAGVAVFHKYLQLENGNRQRAMRRYLSLKESEAAHKKYYGKINAVYQILKKRYAQ